MIILFNFVLVSKKKCFHGNVFWLKNSKIAFRRFFRTNIFFCLHVETLFVEGKFRCKFVYATVDFVRCARVFRLH